MAVVGLDFGCMNAVVAQAERGGVTVLLNENSKRLNACQVSFQGKQRFLGEAAASIARRVPLGQRCVDSNAWTAPRGQRRVDSAAWTVRRREGRAKSAGYLKTFK